MARLPFESALVVCTGNICRSPIGEALLRTRLVDADLPVRVESAGIGAVVGAGAHEHSREVMAPWGVSLDDHIARQFDASLATPFELILALDFGHKQWIDKRFPELSGRTFRLGHWLDEDIVDPIGRPVDEFRVSRDHIDRAIDSWFERFGIKKAT